MLRTFGFAVTVHRYVIAWASRQLDSVRLMPQAVLVTVIKCLALTPVSVPLTVEGKETMKLGKSSVATQCHTSWPATWQLVQFLSQF